MDTSKNIPAPKRRKFLYALLIGAPILGLIVLITLAALYFKSCSAQRKPPEFIEKAKPQVDEKELKIAGKLAQPQTADKNASYDLDETVKALFSIELALNKAKSFEDLTQFILQDDPKLAAPEIIALKCRFFKLYGELLDSRDSVKEMKNLYKLTSGAFLDLFSTINYSGFSASVDHEQAKKIWEKRVAESETNTRTKERLAKCQDQMIDFYFDYMACASKYLNEWDKLCALRDRAYLAVHEGNWDEAVRNAASATQMAPNEKEAHLLLAMSMLERGLETDKAAAQSILEEFQKKQQGQNAAAWLLSGVINLKNKKYESALLDFEQAAAYYPKQQEESTERLNLYKRRAFLNKSKEGRIIINLYRGMVSGSGYFSPDFQIARLLQEEGNAEKANKKIFDHFFRRRLQGQWDRILMDFQYSHRFLKTDLFKISNDAQLSIELKPAFFTNSISVALNNTGKTELHNVTVLLCVRFTDMFPGDYISFPIGETLALLKAGETNTVGRKNITDITEESLGTVKKFKDIIEFAAVVISDELITWVEPKSAGPVAQEQEPTLRDKLTDQATKIGKEALNKAVDTVSEKIESALKDKSNSTPAPDKGAPVEAPAKP